MSPNPTWMTGGLLLKEKIILFRDFLEMSLLSGDYEA